MLHIVPVMTIEDLKKCLDVRHEAFVVEKNVPESIEVDKNDVLFGTHEHFLVCDDDKVLGTFRLFINEHHVCKIERFCFYKEYRGLGYGRYALDFLEGYCLSMEVKKLRLDAQVSAIEFYEKAGYEICSDEFEEAGIKHRKMQKKFVYTEEEEKGLE